MMLDTLINWVGIGLAEMLLLAGLMVASAGILGWLLFQNPGDTFVLTSTAAVAAGLVLACWRIISPGIGTALGVLLVTLAAIIMGYRTSGWRGAKFLAGLWLGYCFTAIIGHAAGGIWGALLITIPTMTLFWLLMWISAKRVLPAHPGAQLAWGLRCLFTFSLGTNYPYLAIQDRRLHTRVEGNPFRGVLGGPGLLITGPDHAAAITTTLGFVGIKGPGLILMSKFQRVLDIIDLHQQQRAFPVTATTKDGIEVRLTGFGPFQVSTGQQTPTIGKPWPFFQKDAYAAVFGRPVEQLRTCLSSGAIVEERTHREWHELYQILSTPILQEIIAEYNFDELFALDEPDRDPRGEISSKYQPSFQAALEKYGIQLIGAGIGNLEPVSEEVKEQQIQNWQHHWLTHALTQTGIAEAEAELILGQAHAQAEHDLIEKVGSALKQVSRDKTPAVAKDTLAVLLLQALEIASKKDLDGQVSEKTLGSFRATQQRLIRPRKLFE